jgi:xylose isomerase
VKVNIEANHATLAGHSFDHEIAMADALGIFGSSTSIAAIRRTAGTPTSSTTIRST